MSEAEPDTDDVEEEPDPQLEQDEGPTFSEEVEELIESAGAEEVAGIEDPDEVEAEAQRRIEIREEHDRELDDGLDDSPDTEEELDRLYNSEGLSLMDIGRLYRVTDATVQRRMEQHGLERRGNRAELSREELIDEMQRLAVELSGAEDIEAFREAAGEGEAPEVTTTAMTDEGNHSAHTYYNYWDSWDEAKSAAGVTVSEVEDVEDDESDD